MHKDKLNDYQSLLSHQISPQETLKGSHKFINIFLQSLLLTFHIYNIWMEENCEIWQLQ